MLVIASVGCALFSTAGLAVSQFVKSPQQAAADSAPPTPSVITAVVEKRVLQTTLINRGKVVAGHTMELTPVAPGVGIQVVTTASVKAGDAIKPGAVLLAVSGRPLFALTGALPAYRDLVPGMKGPDVAQLQKALRQLDYSTRGDRLGYFGAGTKNAVRNLYLDSGYEPLQTGDAGAKTLKATSAEIASIRKRIAALQQRIATKESPGAGEEPLASQLVAMRTALTDAEQERAAVVARTGAMLPLSEVAFVPSLPARVLALSARVGDIVKPPLLKISTGRLTVRLFVPTDQAEQINVGMPADVVSEAMGEEVAGKVSSIGEVVTDSEQKPDRPPPGTPYRTLTVTTGTALPTEWADESVKVTVKAAQTDAATLVIPLSAVSTSADGKTTVSVASAGDTTRRVEIEAGASGDGLVSVKPIKGSLTEGDRVVIGMPS